MAEKQTDKLKTSSSGAESPTTRPELDFDDDVPATPVAATPVTSTAPASTAPTAAAPPPVTSKEEALPTKPPRPMSPQAQAEATLVEAFPSIDAKVVRAVLSASGGQLEPAFNALLGMSDPNFVEEQAPPQPPRPTAQQKQLEQDELYARQLAQHYQNQAASQQRTQSRENPSLQRRQTGEEDRERNFFDDDLPEIGENIRKGFVETQSKVNKWITDFRKRIDGEDEDEFEGRPGSQRQNFGPSQSDQLYGIQRDAERRAARRSGDRDRYDADPQIISDDFTQLRMQDNETAPPQPPRPNRPLANPDLFKPTPAPPQSGPVDEVEALYSRPTPNRQPSPGANKTKKWQPLTSVAPNPEADDHDPFSLGDSDDEDSKSKDIKAEDSERLKKAAADPVSPIEGTKPIEAAERSGSMGTRNKEAEELLAKESK